MLPYGVVRLRASVNSRYEARKLQLPQRHSLANLEGWNGIGRETMTAKLRVDLSQGVLEVEGDESFVRAVFENFQAQMQLVRHASPRREPAMIEQVVEEIPTVDATPTKPAKKSVRSRSPERRTGDTNAKGMKNWNFKLDNSIQIDGLSDFIKPYAIKNHSERILLYGKYLETIGIYPFNANHVYTLYSVRKDKMPIAFVQAFIDARGSKYQYVGFENLDSIEFTIAGINHFNHHMEQAVGDE